MYVFVTEAPAVRFFLAKLLCIYFVKINRVWKRRCQHVYVSTLAASSGKRNVTIWPPSVRPSVCFIGILTVTHQGQHATRPAYISTDSKEERHTCISSLLVADSTVYITLIPVSFTLKCAYFLYVISYFDNIYSSQKFLFENKWRKKPLTWKGR